MYGYNTVDELLDDDRIKPFIAKYEGPNKDKLLFTICSKGVLYSKIKGKRFMDLKK